MRRIKSTIQYSLNFLSKFFPRNKRTWVFIGWHMKGKREIFADNTKYLFLHVSQNEPDIKAIWLAKDNNLVSTLRKRGYHAYHQKSILGIYYALRAGVTCIDAFLQPYNFQFSGGSKITQLLHGKGMKKGGYNTKPIQKNDYIFTTSPFMTKLIPSIFKKGSKVFETGFPRNDILFK